jgi:hypothetical protein
MKLSEFKNQLNKIDQVNFLLPSGKSVPKHFHVTEIGQIHKNFIDCGGTIRNEKVVSFQLWAAEDVDHTLVPEKLLNIITLSEKKLAIEDSEIEVEYQSNTIGKYHLDFDGNNFLLLNTKTDCLASDKCGITSEKLKISLADLPQSNQKTNGCSPEGKCC